MQRCRVDRCGKQAGEGYVCPPHADAWRASPEFQRLMHGSPAANAAGVPLVDFLTRTSLEALNGGGVLLWTPCPREPRCSCAVEPDPLGACVTCGRAAGEHDCSCGHGHHNGPCSATEEAGGIVAHCECDGRKHCLAADAIEGPGLVECGCSALVLPTRLVFSAACELAAHRCAAAALTAVRP